MQGPGTDFPQPLRERRFPPNIGGRLVYGSVCSGIEAATVAWHGLDWRPAFFSEVDSFPRAVLEHHYPMVPLHGDFTTIKDNDYEPIDLLVGGTPCQAFSVAGLRRGLADERGNLTLEFVRLAERLRPRWVVWENVPGVLSIDGGRAFGAFLGGMAEIGYGVSYRVLDAQHFGVPQRRRRVYVVGYLGDWRPPAAVLFEPESLSWDPAACRAAREGASGGVATGAELGGGKRTGRSSSRRGRGYHALAFGGNNLQGPIDRAPCLLGHSSRFDFESETFVASAQYGQYRGGDYPILRACGRGHEAITVGFSCKDAGGDASTEVAPTLRAMSAVASRANAGGQLAVASFHQNQRNEIRLSPVVGALSSSGGGKPGQGYPAVCITGQITHSLRADGYDGSEDGTGRGTPVVPVGVQIHGSTATARSATYTDVAGAILTKPPGRLENSSTTAVLAGAAVRRLTPRECERLQGFPDDYTLVTYRGRLAADGPRYKALGNSMAVPVMRWIGQRVEMVDKVKPDLTVH